MNEIQAYSDDMDDDYASLNHLVESCLDSNDSASLEVFNPANTEEAQTVQPVIIAQGLDSSDVSSHAESLMSNKARANSMPYSTNSFCVDDGKLEKAGPDQAGVPTRIPKGAADQPAPNCHKQGKRLKCFV